MGTSLPFTKTISTLRWGVICGHLEKQVTLGERLLKTENMLVYDLVAQELVILFQFLHCVAQHAYLGQKVVLLGHQLFVVVCRPLKVEL